MHDVHYAGIRFRIQDFYVWQTLLLQSLITNQIKTITVKVFELYYVHAIHTFLNFKNFKLITLWNGTLWSLVAAGLFLIAMWWRLAMSVPDIFFLALTQLEM